VTGDINSVSRFKARQNGIDMLLNKPPDETVIKKILEKQGLIEHQVKFII